MIARIASIPLTAMLIVCIGVVFWFVGKGSGVLLGLLAKAVFG